MNIIVFGASGGTGRAVIEQALEAGHVTTAFVRNPTAFDGTPHPNLRIVEGDATHAADVQAALAAQDAIVLTLGNPQTSLARLFGARRTTAPDVCEVGTRHILSALEALNRVPEVPIIVVSAFGVGDTREKLPLAFKLFYVLLKEQMADKERQESLLKASSSKYVLVQPVALTDKPAAGVWTASAQGELGASEVSRSDLASFILQEIETPKHVGMTVTFSG